MMNPAMNISVPREPKKCMGLLPNLVIKLIVSMSR